MIQEVTGLSGKCTEPAFARLSAIPGLGTPLDSELLVGFVEVVDDVAAPRHTWLLPESCGHVR